MAGAGSADQRGQLAVLRRGHVEAQHALLDRLHRAGWRPEQLVGLTLGDLLPSPARRRLMGYRCALQLPYAADAPVAVDDEGHALAADDLELALLVFTPA